MAKLIGKLALWLALLAGIAFYFYPHIERALYPIKYESEVVKASNDYDLPRNLILAVIREESGFDSESYSSVSARGLMQLLPSTGQWIADTRGITFDQGSINKPSINIDFGSWYLRYLIEQLHSDTLALEAYNGGITNVHEWEKKQPGYVGFAETDQFVKRVKLSREAYDQVYGEHWEKRK